MKAIDDYKNMVIALVTSGIEIKPALDAAEVVIFGIQERMAEKPSQWAQTVSTWPDAVKIKADEPPIYFTQGQLAKQLKMSTASFNKMLRSKGFLRREMIDAHKPFAAGSLCYSVSTYRITEKGDSFGRECVHNRYADGSPAVRRIKWKDSIISEISK